MLALVLAVLAAVAGLPSGGMAEDASIGAVVVEGTVAERGLVEASSHVFGVGSVPCCETDAEGEAAPCGPGDSCPPFGGCCACVACGERVADTPPVVAPVATLGRSVDRVAARESSGIDGEGAVWHPPRG